jgi:hypothetical protein
LPHIGGVKFVIHQAVGGAKNHRAIIRPCAARLAMRAEFAHVFDRIRLQSRATHEFHRDAQSIADERTPQAA